MLELVPPQFVAFHPLRSSCPPPHRTAKSRLPRYNRLVISTAVRYAIVSYRARLEDELPRRVLRMALFGSWARGEAHEDSDVDVLVVLSHGTSADRARAIDAGGQIGLERGLVIAPLVFTESEWAELSRRERRLVREIERDGVPV